MEANRATLKPNIVNGYYADYAELYKPEGKKTFNRYILYGIVIVLAVLVFRGLRGKR
jgi:hypothetical protein